MKQPQNVTLSETEQKILANEQGSLVVVNTENKRTKAIVEQFLKQKVTTKLEDGTSVDATIEELITMKALTVEMVKSRGFQTLLDLQKIRGELVEKKEVEVGATRVDEDLKKRAIQ